MNKISGQTISQAAALIEDVGSEIDAMLSALESKLSEKIVNTSVVKTDSKIKNTYSTLDSGWVCDSVSFSIPLKESKKKKNASKYLSVQVSLFGEGIEYTTDADSKNCEPLIHVCLWDDPITFDDGYMGFPIDKGYAVQKNIIHWEKSAWTFSLPLLAIDSTESLDKLIVEPVINILKLYKLDDFEIDKIQAVLDATGSSAFIDYTNNYKQD